MTEKKNERQADDGQTPKVESNIRIDMGMGGLFKGIGNLVDLISALSEAGETITSRTGEIDLGKAKGEDVRAVYGFTVRSGLGGLPRVESFGNVRETDDGPTVTEIREPLVDVFDEGETILVVGELPGVSTEEIVVSVQGDVLAIATNGKRKYAKEVLLPAPVSNEDLNTVYNNGVLEVRLRKA